FPAASAASVPPYLGRFLVLLLTSCGSESLQEMAPTQEGRRRSRHLERANTSWVDLDIVRLSFWAPGSWHLRPPPRWRPIALFRNGSPISGRRRRRSGFRAPPSKRRRAALSPI